VLFQRQVECYGKLQHHLFDALNVILQLQGLLGEGKAEDARQLFLEKSKPFDLHFLVREYFVYLPGKILVAARPLLHDCRALMKEGPTEEKLKSCRGHIGSLRSAIRDCVGVDAISRDHLQAAM